MSDQLKLSYNAALLRVKCEIPRSVCLQSDVPPADLLARAKAKMEAIKTAGDVAFYLVYEQRLLDVWKALRDVKDEPESRRVIVTLAAGARALPGLKVEKAATEKALVNLSIDAPRDATAAWRYEWFKLAVVKRMRDLGIKEAPNGAQLYGAFTRGRAGERVQNLPIGPTGGPQGQYNRPYSVVANKQRLEIGVVIRSIKEVSSPAARDGIFNLINQAVKQLAVDGTEYKVLKKDLLAVLQSSQDGPESLGLELPLVLLAAIGSVPTRQAAPANYPGAGLISFNVSPDKMEATITGFDLKYYDDATFEVGVEWLQSELKCCGITVPMTDDIVKVISEALKNSESLNGKVAARGVMGIGGKGPYVYAAFKDAAGRVEANLDSDNLDIREMQQRATVKSGQLVAMIKHKEPPVPGRNIYGDDVPSPPDEQLIINVGEGIQQREPGKYYATSDGLPMLEGDSISLSKVLVHNGDVNLSTGNIRFDGPVEIKGSIESGAVVETSGDLIVHGTIRGGKVRVAGSMQAKAGIVTGVTGRIQVKHDITAEFIENSNIICGGNMVVAKALINSEVICGGQIKVQGKTGIVAGGHISVKDSLITGNLGFRHGAATVLNVGVDARVARAIDIRQVRLDKLTKKQLDDRQAMRELVQKSKAQLTQRHKELKEELQERVARLRGLIEKATAHLEKVKSQLTYNQAARIYVSELLAANVNITIGGQNVAVVNEVAGVAVLPKRRRGSYIVPIEEVEKEDAEKNGGAPPTSKKAS